MYRFSAAIAGTGHQRLTLIWGTLLLLTLLSFYAGGLAAGRHLMLLVLMLALFKVQLVIDHFMGLRRVYRIWRLLMACYLATVGVLIAIAFLTT